MIKLITLECRTPYIPGKMVHLYATQYVAGGLALMLVDTEDGETIVKPSVWFYFAKALKPNQFICKSYAENEGIEPWLLKSGICIDPRLPLITLDWAACRILQLNDELSAVLKAGWHTLPGLGDQHA